MITTRSDLIRRAVALALVGATSTAVAQNAANTAANDLQEVVVTGSMIKRTNAETAEAITILKADDLKNMGVQTIEQALGMLVANSPSVNVSSAVGSFSGGGTYANLRNLGNGRTLVLLDGQRLASNANDGSAVDLAGIPFSAIESVEVLREGASALYGADAISGVINFKTKQSYQGAEASINYDRTQHGHGNSGQVELTFGHGDVKTDGYNFIVTASYSRQNELQAPNRGFSQAGYNPAGGYTSTNNPGSWPGTFADSNNNYYQAGYPACAGNPYLTTDFGNCAYRYSVATDLLPQTSNTSALVGFTKALPANNKIEAQYFYTRSELTGWSGPMFYYFQMDPKSPYYPTASTPLTCIASESADCTQKPNLAGGGAAIWTDPNNNRYGGNINEEQRLLLSFTGTNAGWDYAAYANYSQNKNDNRNVSGYPNEAVLAPGGVLSDLINPFGAQSAAGQALIDQSYINGTYALGKDKRWSVDVNGSHSLGDAFNSGIPSTVALGASIAGERFEYATTPYNDLVSAATGLGASAVSGSRNSQAAYAEIDLPVSKALDLDISYRYDRYSDFGTTNNPKIKLTYKAADFLTVRGSASTGFRAPTLYSLYSPPFIAAATSGTMGAGNPFCSPGNYTTVWTQAICNTQGLGVSGGNPHLQPETSQNFNLGVVLSPLRDLGVTIDYYRIVLKNTIGGVPATAIYGDPTAFASYIVTNNAGTLTPSIQSATSCTPYTAPTCGYIKLNSSNTGHISTDGIDLSVQYVQHSSIGTFREDLEGTAVTQFDTQTYTGGPTRNLVGWYNQSLPAYRWTHNLRVDWTSPDSTWSAGLSNRLYSSYIDQFPDGNGKQRIVGTYTVFDGYVGVKPIPKLSVLFGIKNLLDKSPPYTNSYQSNFAAGYNALIADPLLRNFYINLRYTFL